MRYPERQALSPAAISRMIARGVAAEAERTIRCQAHAGAHPTITIVHASSDGLEFAIAGCCDSLRKRTRSSIDALLGSGAIDRRHRSTAA